MLFSAGTNIFKYSIFLNRQLFYNSWDFLFKKLENVKTMEIDSPLPPLSLSPISVWVVKFSCQGVAD